MYIVIAGGGMVGGSLASRLLENKHDVVLIDQDKDVCDRMYAETGGIAVNGNCANIEILKEAGVSKADVVVAATGNDANNLAFAILAKSFGVEQIIARMRDPEYKKAYSLAGVNKMVRVTDLMVNNIMMDIEKPQVRRVTTIGGGKANIFMVVVPQDAHAAGMNIEAIAKNRKFPSQCVFIAVYNQEKEVFSIPRGKQIINSGDELFLISNADDIKKAVDFLTAKK